MKVEDLDGMTLDYWVARALGYASPDDVPSSLTGEWASNGFKNDWQPSEDWSQGGPILAHMIESGEFCVWEYGGTVTVSNHDPEGIPCKEPSREDIPKAMGEASTLLVAMCRALVMSKFGEEVPDSAMDAPPMAG
jgi:hypothetical protein